MIQIGKECRKFCKAIDARAVCVYPAWNGVHARQFVACCIQIMCINMYQ